ncbi:uncharacterized protein BO80DRAFT_503765 [Aspergillus ibericus CBS 121593]|uniref:BTB domain-containing protein n=1 Tax=Aspergillus ibericus CBS 121593 TaxID=1448316 RepID=A0A395GXD9_9EURO|nr:hypothetical protein BO80DRAFT_503765 [Aspergillus ibericus CBS 121593]RAK98723.1 hypothetical protein BO80DRAFT_503765 [Aspergillus ibericus CBS 121593]
MSHNLNGRLFAETPLSIRVGSNKKLYYVHPKALSSSSSSALHARVTGPWMNCGDGEIDWTDFDEQTIDCVLNFLYTGDYQAGRITQRPGEQSQQRATEESEEIEKDKEIHASRQQLKEYELAYRSIHEPLSPIESCLDYHLPFEDSPVKAVTLCQETLYEDIPNELLLHAKVYLFAHRYLLDDLADLSLRYLQQALINLPKKQPDFPQQLADAVCLIYTETATSELQENPGRKLLSQFVALKYTGLYNDRLEKLLAEGGPFTIDVSRKLARRLMSSPLEERIQELSNSNESLRAELADKDRETKALTRELHNRAVWNNNLPVRAVFGQDRSR